MVALISIQNKMETTMYSMATFSRSVGEKIDTFSRSAGEKMDRAAEKWTPPRDRDLINRQSGKIQMNRQSSN